jgi:hypothetical protein
MYKNTKKYTVMTSSDIPEIHKDYVLEADKIFRGLPVG